MQKFIFIFAVFFVAILLGLWFFRNEKDVISKPLVSSKPGMSPVSVPTPTPIPFAEMTIPYLRQRQFDSKLSELQKASENQDYTFYLTSFSSDGYRVNGLLTKPKGEEPKDGFPAVVFVHGYISPAEYTTLGKYNDYVDYLAKNGFVVFKIDLRGHGSSEGEAVGGYFSPNYVIDTISAYTALQNADFVNREKIGLWGHSMAGNIIMRAAAVRPEIPAIVIWSGAVYTYKDFTEYSIEDNSYKPLPRDSEYVKKTEKLFEVHGYFDKESPFWAQVAPANYLNDLKGAVQIHHAKDDNVVDIRYSRNLDNLLNQTSVPHQLNEYPTGGHNITGPSFTVAMQNTVDFFDRYLK